MNDKKILNLAACLQGGFGQPEARSLFIGKEVEQIMPMDKSISYLSHNLETIDVDPENKFFTAIDDVLFDKDMTTLILYPAKNERSEYTVPKTVKKFGDFAFANALYLNFLILEQEIIYIQNKAFESTWIDKKRMVVTNPDKTILYKYIDNVNFDRYATSYMHDLGKAVSPDLTTIKNEAIVSRGKLHNMTIPGKVTTIEPYAFKNILVSRITLECKITTGMAQAIGNARPTDDNNNNLSVITRPRVILGENIIIEPLDYSKIKNYSNAEKRIEVYADECEDDVIYQAHVSDHIFEDVLCAFANEDYARKRRWACFGIPCTALIALYSYKYHQTEEAAKIIAAKLPEVIKRAIDKDDVGRVTQLAQYMKDVDKFITHARKGGHTEAQIALERRKHEYYKPEKLKL